MAVFTTAPSPVMTPQASSEALSSGTSFGIATACEDSTTTCSAKAPVRSPCTIAAPSPEESGLASSSGKLVSQATGAPWAQKWHWPQARISVTTTWSPGLTFETPAPTASTTPAASWP